MKLNLIPPRSYPIPSILHSHDLPSPSIPPARTLRIPLAYVKAKRTLNDLGLQLPSHLAADRALWWQFAVSEVTWDLDEEELVVAFSDGSEERWEFDGGAGARSDATVGDDSDESVDELSADAEEDRRRAKRARSTPSQAGERARPGAPSTVLARLNKMCVELRSAYEDLGTSSSLHPDAPIIESEADFAILMQLAADPSRDVPFEWSSAKSLLEYHMQNSGGEDDGEDENAGANSMSISPTRTSQSGKKAEGAVVGNQPRHGQFKSRQRPRRLPSSASSLAPAPTSRHPQHDYLSLVHLLTRVRQYLADLFASNVLPKLRENLPPTYALWAVAGAISWCRRKAIRKSAEAAKRLLELLDNVDDGDVIRNVSVVRDDPVDPDLCGADTSEDSMDLDLDDEAGWGGAVEQPSPHRSRQGDDWNAFALHEKRQSDNPLASMRDDFTLRCWCEDVMERARAFSRDEWLVPEREPKWVRKPGAWNVSAPIDGADSDLDELPGQQKEKGFKPASALLLPETLTPNPSKVRLFSPPTSPPRAEEEGLHGAVTLMPALVASSASSDTDPSDLEDDVPNESDSCDFFYPEDLTGERFLPKRLPKAVVKRSETRGKEMEKARVQLHKLLNEVAGLQKKMHELQEFVADETRNWKHARAEERKEKAPSPVSASGLCTPGASSTSPPPPSRRKSSVPLKGQPLRHQTADRALAEALGIALRELEPKAKIRSGVLKKVKVAPAKRRASPPPRKRQKSNLEALEKLRAMSTLLLVDHPRGKEGEKKRARDDLVELVKKRGMLSGEGGGAGGGPSKKRARKSMPIKREGGEVDVLAGPSQTARPSSSATTLTSARNHAVATRLSIVELSYQRHRSFNNVGLPLHLGWPAEELRDLPLLPQENIRILSEPKSGDGDIEDRAELADEDDEALMPAFDEPAGAIDPGEEAPWQLWTTATPNFPPYAILDELFRPTSSFPRSFASTSASSSPPAPIVTANAFPTSSSRDEPSEIDPLLRSPTFDPSSRSCFNIVSPQPLRPFYTLPAPPITESDPVPHPWSELSPALEEGGLAKKMRGKIGLMSKPSREIEEEEELGEGVEAESLTPASFERMLELTAKGAAGERKDDAGRDDSEVASEDADEEVVAPVESTA
ncbi:hypothetical protein JCM1841_004837 [Sporobolomyces salmonicolor]